MKHATTQPEPHIKFENKRPRLNIY